MQVDVITYHGWGYGPKCWASLEKIVSSSQPWKHANFGYFNEEERPTFQPSSEAKVVIMHSFGLHKCPHAILQQADALIICSGFAQFHPQAAQFQRRSRQIISQMREKLASDPRAVLTQFYKNTAYPASSPIEVPRSVNTERLMEHLASLSEASLQLPKLQDHAQVMILHGEDDRIIPKQKGRGLRALLPVQTQYFELKAAGHGLPFTHASSVARLIEPALTFSKTF